MPIQLRNISFATFVDRVFAHPAPEDDEDPWYFGEVTFEVDPAQQLDHMTELFLRAGSLPGYGLSNAQIGSGLWCVLGGARNDHFVSLLWDPTLQFGARSAAIGALFELYDGLLSAEPYEAIDFRHPDLLPRRFDAIDYMALALVVEATTPIGSTANDRVHVRSALLEVLARLLDHPAPVAQYAALHGLGHLPSKQRIGVIDRYLANRAGLQEAQREYALSARGGKLL